MGLVEAISVEAIGLGLATEKIAKLRHSERPQIGCRKKEEKEPAKTRKPARREPRKEMKRGPTGDFLFHMICPPRTLITN
jgi:hypothetical protein